MPMLETLSGTTILPSNVQFQAHGIVAAAFNRAGRIFRRKKYAFNDTEFDEHLFLFGSVRTSRENHHDCGQQHNEPKQKLKRMIPFHRYFPYSAPKNNCF